MSEMVALNGVEDAMKELDALEADRTASEPTPSASDEQRAAQSTEVADAEAQLLQHDTPAEAEPGNQPAPETKADTKADEQAQVETQQKPAEDKGSKFAKDQARRDTTWKALNAEKETFKTERAAFEAERAAFKRDREAAEAESSVTPEKYDSYAKQMRAQADHLKAEADRLEADGKFDEAEAKRDDARDAEADIKRATKAADELRRNPPATIQQRNEQVAAAKKEWTLKAAQDFPELAKDGSEFQRAVAQTLSEMQQHTPGMLRDPRSIYFVTKLVAAETAAAGVPELKTKLSQTEARVKELEALTGPTPPGQHGQAVGEVPFDQRSRDEQFAELERLATGMPLR